MKIMQIRCMCISITFVYFVFLCIACKQISPVRSTMTSTHKDDEHLDEDILLQLAKSSST